MIPFDLALDIGCVNKIEKVLKKKSLDLYSLNKEGLSLLERLIEKDIEKDCFKFTKLLFKIFYHDKEKILNFQLSSGFTLKEEIYLYPEYVSLFDFLIDKKIMSVHDEYFNKKENVNTNYLFLSILNNNFRLVQKAQLLDENIIYQRDKNNNSLFSFALLHGSNQLISLFLNKKKLNLKELNNQDLDPIAFTLSRFRDMLNKNLSLYSNKLEMDRVISNIHTACVFFNYKINKPTNHKAKPILFETIEQEDFRFLDLLHNRFLVSFKDTYKLYHPFDYACKTMNFDLCLKFFEYQKKYNTNYINIDNKNKGKSYVNCLGSVYILCDKKVDVNDFRTFFHKMSNKLNITHKNSYGYNHLHALCANLTQENFAFLSEVLVFLIKELRIHPLEMNRDRFHPFQLIQDRFLKEQVLWFLHNERLIQVVDDRKKENNVPPANNLKQLNESQEKLLKVA